MSYDTELEVVVEKKGGFFGKLIALLLGFIIGLISCLGGVAAFGYFFLTKIKVKEGFDYINGFTGQELDYTQYINGEYGEKTVLDLIGVLSVAVTEISEGRGTLNTLAHISPVVDKLVKGDPDAETPSQGFVGALQDFGLKVNGDDLMNRVLVKPASAMEENNPDVYLTDYIKEGINTMPMGDLFNAMGYPLNDLMFQLCYGTKDKDYTYDADGNVVMLGDATPLTIGGFLDEDLMTRFSSMPLESLLSPETDDAIMLSVNYGPTHRYEIQGKNIVMKQLFYRYNAEEDKLLDDEGYEVENGVLTLLNAETRVYQLVLTDAETEETETLYLQANETGDILYAFEDEALTEKIYFDKITVGDLQEDGSDIIRSITLKDALGVTDKTTNRLLLALAYEGERERTIGDLWTNGSDIINGIHLADMLHVDLSNHLITYFLYGKQDIHYKLVPDPDWVAPIDPETGEPVADATPDYLAEMLPRKVAVLDTTKNGQPIREVYNEYGDVCFGTADTNDFFYISGTPYKLVAEPTLGTLDIEGKEATFYYVYDLNNNQVYFEEPTLGELMAENSPILNNIMNHLTVSDILGEEQADENKLLTLMRDVAIADMATEVNKVRIVDIFESDVYETNTEGEFVDENGFVTTNPDEYVMLSTWKYLLTEDVLDEDGNPVIGADGEIVTVINKELTISHGMGAMMTNMTRNIQRATMAQLIRDDILVLEGSITEKWEEYEADETLQNNPNHPFNLTINGMLNAIFTAMP